MSLPPLWDMVEQARAFDGARTLILAVGKAPMVRIAEEGLRPIDDALPQVTHTDMARLLSIAVEPEQWYRLEQVGDGEFTLARGTGRPITMTVFRASESWSIVVRF